VTAPEILFFWVARMIIAGYEFAGKKPFENVYLTGIVRDKLGRKMSKSLGNSPDPIKMMEEHGADAVRVGMLLTSPAGNDLPFDLDLVTQGRNFANKIWNGFRLVKSWDIDNDKKQPDYAKAAVNWYQNRFNQVLNEIEDDFSKYRISNALMRIYKLIWDDYSSWFLEMIKPPFGEKIDVKTYQETIKILENNLKVLHPFMPFMTEEIWQHIKERSPKEAIIIAKYPELQTYGERLLKQMAQVQEIISGIRKIRKENNIPQKEAVNLFILEKEQLDENLLPVLQKLAHVEQISKTDKAYDNAASFRVGFNEFFVPLEGLINPEEEKQKLQEELDYTKGFLKSVQKKLSNERFVNNAPEKVVAMEKKKEADALGKIALLEKRLKSL